MRLTTQELDQWYVLYTLSKHEKKIESYLKKEGIEVFLPIYTTIRQWSDRKRKLTLPLFPNYLFVKTNPRDFWRITTMNGVIKFVSNGKEPASVPQTTIHNIQKVIKGDFKLKESLMTRGEYVRVTEGPFAGIEGRFIKNGNKNMLIIEIDIIQRSLMLEVEPLQIQKIQKFKL